MVDELRSALSDLIVLKKDPVELVEYLRERLRENPEIPPKLGSKKSGILVMKDILEIDHPVLRKLVDYGNLSRQLNLAISGTLENLVKLIEVSPRRSVKLSSKLLNILKDEVVNNIVQKMREGFDLRPMMMPGSVTLGETPNLYYGDESYSPDEKVDLAFRLMKSIGIGKNIAVFFEGDFQSYLEDKVREKMGRRHLDGSDIGCGAWETSKPFLTLIRLLIWFYDQILEDIDSEKVREEIIKMMKESSGILYFTPGNDKENYTAVVFPQLSRFVESWLEDESKRKILKGMLNSIKRISSAAYKKGGASAQPQIEILYHYMEILSMGLVNHSSIEWEPLRRVVNLIIDITSRYDLVPDLYFIRELSSMESKLLKKGVEQIYGGRTSR